ncbi:MAG: hypothetical protein P8R42_11345 [Candidatus Binatia bacterium]|nr:hypothetical protein [Candidatus Binatia bacterium]
MKLRGPTWALVGLAAAGFVALSASASLAVNNIYESDSGLSEGLNATYAPSGPNLNPNGIGQFLLGSYYDVRVVDGDSQINNIQIINTNTNNSTLPGGACDDDDRIDGVNGGGSCYDPDGGILAKVRFRESKTSKEVLDFVIALSCGEVWAGRLALNGTTGLPEISSSFPIVTSFSGVSVTTSPAFRDSAQGFAPTGIPTGLTAEDIQRGHFEVVAMESLPCEPDSGKLSLDGNVWTRPRGTPSNAIGGEVFLVRAGAGVSHAYNLEALSNFAPWNEGPVTPVNLFAGDAPKFSDCTALDQTSVSLTGDQCVAGANMALSKSRLIAQYDVEDTTAGRTLVVVTFPTKYENCNATNGTWTGPLPANGPFECGATEEVTCTIYDRLENFFEEEEGFISPSPEAGRCTLNREVNVIQLAQSAADADGRADQVFATGSLPAGDSGWLDLDLARNLSGTVIHKQVIGDGENNVLGIYMGGYHGMPTVGLVIQEFFNGSVGGVYGNTVPPLYEQTLLRPGES